MKFVLKDVSGMETTVEDFIFYEINRSIATPCDGITFSFLTEKSLSEQHSIEVWQNKILVFNGFVDYQSQKIQSNQSCVVIKGRSSACILVDSECSPISYHTPSVNDLFEKYAKPYGFTSELTQMACDYNLDVVKGSSRWTVLFNFVKCLEGSGFYASPSNQLVPFNTSGGKWIFSNDNDFYRSVQKSKNYQVYHFTDAVLKYKRSSPISKVIYKIDSSDEYKYSAVCHKIDEKGIHRERYLNLANIPAWKRTNAVHSVIENSYNNYFSITVSIGENFNFKLNDTVDFVDKTIGDFKNLRIKEITCMCNSGGEKTILHLATGETVQEDIYVD